MNLIKKTVPVPTMLIVGALCAIIAYQASATRFAANPTVVVTVNRKAVLDGLNERAEAEARLMQMGEKFKAEKERREAELNLLRDQINAETSQEVRMQLLSGFEKKELEYKGYLQFISEKLDVDKYVLYESLYRSISEAIKLMAESEGYDIVIVDDSAAGFSLNPNSRASRESQILQQIAARRVMYTNPITDITQDLIVRMNNVHNAG